MKSLKQISFFILLVICCCKCTHKDPDPCASLKLTTANFIITEELQPINSYEYNSWKPYPTDTVIYRRAFRVGITASQDSLKNTKYEWILGNGIYNDKQLFVNFNNKYSNRPEENIVTVRLRVMTEPNKSCFPIDDGMETLTKNIVFVSDSMSALKGSFLRGKKDTIKFLANKNFVGLWAYNLEGSKGWSSPAILGYKQFLTGYGCLASLFPDNNTLTVSCKNGDKITSFKATRILLNRADGGE